MTRYPELKASFGLSELTFGLMVACGPVGAIIGSLVAGRLVARWGAAKIAVTSSALLGALLMVVGVAGGPVILAAILFVIGFGDATGDVANNAHGLVVQRLMRRSIINGLHGAWSAGAITGALLGAAALQLGLPIQLHLAVIGALIVVGSVAVILPLRLPVNGVAPDAERASGTPVRTRYGALLIAACAIATIGILLEDVGSTWGGVYAVAEADASVVDAAIPFAALMAALTVSRFVSDAVVNRIGPVATIRLGAVFALAGIATVVLLPETLFISTGLALIGLGIGPMIPQAMDAADRTPGLSPGSGLAIASTVMRIGSLATPLLIGGLGEIAGMRTAFAIVIAVPIAVLFLAGPLRTPKPD